MIRAVLEKLDLWMEQENNERREDGGLLLKKITIKIVGQTALLEAKLDLELLNTTDVDAFINGEYFIRKKFDDLLKAHGRHLDPDSDKIWMPEETEYHPIYRGNLVEGFLADYEAVLLSKARGAPDKNRVLIVEYLANKPSERFFKMAEKYQINLEKFV